MEQEHIDKVAKILAEGGSIYMHPNDLEKLKSVVEQCNRLGQICGVNIIPAWMVSEGKPVAAKIAGFSPMEREEI